MSATTLEAPAVASATTENEQAELNRTDGTATELEAVTREDVTRVDDAVSQDALMAAVDKEAEPVALELDGRLIWARPLDTRRFVREMAPFICFN